VKKGRDSLTFIIPISPPNPFATKISFSHLLTKRQHRQKTWKEHITTRHSSNEHHDYFTFSISAKYPVRRLVLYSTVFVFIYNYYLKKIPTTVALLHVLQCMNSDFQHKTIYHSFPTRRFAQSFIRKLCSTCMYMFVQMQHDNYAITSHVFASQILYTMFFFSQTT
jgi:hypothetical protein